VKPVLATLEKRGALWRGTPENGDEILLHSENVAPLEATIKSTLAAFHKSEPLAPALAREVLRNALPSTLSSAAFEALLLALSRAQSIALEPSGVRLASHRVTLSEDETRLKNHLLETAHEAAWQALTPEELIETCDSKERDAAKKLCFALIKEGALVRAGDYVLTKERLNEGAQILKNHLQKNSTLSISEARDLLNATRKWLVPLLEYYDRSGLTRRAGDSRVLR
jgi:selenocysteine-specific elongation factor